MFKHILRNLVLPVIIFVGTFESFAQSKYNNEWIDYSKPYVKIPVMSDGIFRLNYNDLSVLGVPVNDVSKATIKLFHRGVEQAIADYPGANASTSYMEFFGKRNDGTVDSLLYGSEKQLNKYYNLFSDTAYYFLSWEGNAGKRIQNYNGSISGISALYHIKDTLTVFKNEYAKGNSYFVYTHESAYNTGEGWTSGSFRGSTTFGIKMPNFNINSKDVKLNIQLVGRNENSNNISVSIGSRLSNLKLLDQIVFKSCDSYLGQYSISDMSYLSDSIYVVLSNSNLNSRFSVSFIALNYPQKLVTSANKYITIPANTADYVVLPLDTNLRAIYDISDLNNIKKIGFQLSDSIRFAIPNSLKDASFYFDRYEVVNISKLERVTFKNYKTTANTFVIVSHPSLMVKSGQYQNVVRSYSDYRASKVGGSYDTLLVSVTALYNQFSFGEKSPLAIKKFCDYLTKDTLIMPKYLFLIGKAYEYGIDSTRKYPVPSYIDLVPTYGTPGSDIKFSANVYPYNLNVPAIPTGRYTAQNAADVASYLDKIKEHEALAYDQLWRKNMIHLSGGKKASEIQKFRGNVDYLKSIVEGQYKGAQVSTFSKSTSDIQVFDISVSVNKGVSAITFFGHSSPTTNDIDIGYVSDPFLGYNNKGKYPIIILHGCQAGNPFTKSSFGENWMKTPNKGAISMMGNTDYAYEDLLKAYSTTFYNTAFKDTTFFSAGIGDINKEVCKRFPELNLPRNLAQMEQMVLQGDPSVVIFGPTKPDYYTNDDQLFLKSFDGKPITAVSDSFAVGIAISNFGRVTSSGFNLSVERTADGVKKNLPVMHVNPVSYKDTVYYVIYSRDLATAGQNSIKIHLNYNDNVIELNKNNNIGILNFYVPKTGLTCLMPQEFSIVNTSTVSLVAQATDVLSDLRDYVFEIDTSYAFNSAVYKRTELNSGASVSWKNVNLFANLPSNLDSVVFFWRVKFKTLLSGESPLVAQSSFIYIKNAPNGWSQTVFEQFNKDALVDGLEKDTLLKKWIFGPKIQKISVSTAGGTGTHERVVIKLNDFPIVKNGSCRNFGGDGIYALAFDKNTLKPYTFFELPLFREYPILHCSQPVNRFVNLSPNYNIWPNYKHYFKQFVDSVKTGDYVLLVSAGNAHFESWSEGNSQPPFEKYLDKKVEELGCKKLSLLKDEHPYIFLGKKGSDPLIEMIADSNSADFPKDQIIKIDTFLQSASPSASLVSTKIGPTTKWGKFYREFLNLESPTQDKWSVDLLGYNLQGDETIILKDTVLADGFDLSSVVDAKIYPFLKLKVTLQDFGKFTPAQIKKLQVLFDPVPEGTVGLDGAKYKNIGLKQEGDSVVLNFSFTNIFNKDFSNPLLVKYKLLTNSKEVINITDTIHKVLHPDSVFTFKKTFNSLGHVGDNMLEVFVNPLHQPEQSYDNNRWVVPFSVAGDKQNPLLDVYFDGMRIMNGDVVAANPDIQIILKDENKFLAKKDTVGMSLYLKKCETCDFERILMSSPDLFIHYPSSANNNKLSINYYPKNLPDGKYTLRVQGADASNNIAGIQPYQIAFEVVNKSAISNFYPYPNPFSSATRFVYTLTGAQIPEEVKIQIVTVSGKVVKEITQDELGPLRTGTHQTDFVWNGTDEFGDKLANGVYLYRVILKSQGQKMELRQTAGDKAFTDGWGKMYILR